MNSCVKKNLEATLRLLCVLCGGFSFATAQLNLTPSYTFLYSKQWDEIFQTYNFSRPWQQPLSPLAHGIGARLGFEFLFSEKGQVFLNPHIGYKAFSSSITNNGTEISTGIQLLEGGIEIRINPKALFKQHGFIGALGPRWFISITPGYTFFLPHVKRNGERIETAEDEIYRPLSSSFCASLGSGYHLLMVGRFVLTPTLSAAWFPVAELYNFSEAVNGHNQTALKNQSENVLMFNAGLRISMTSTDKSWWQKRGGG
ncbi:MAG: autotransporter outer membrane beta-barrel domain-containing protein [Flavobacteriales bacterium]|nr:autotransporter outer membrane beta-barrel domain-containing protein [Flavobacteriales bacterium]